MSSANRFQCCFCGATIADSPMEPVHLIIPVEGDGTQEIFCHLKCLQGVLHPSVALAISEPEDE